MKTYRVILSCMILWGFWSTSENIARAENTFPECIFHPGLWILLLFFSLEWFRPKGHKFGGFLLATLPTVLVLVVAYFIFALTTEVRRPSDDVINAACALIRPPIKPIREAAMYRPGKTNPLVLLSTNGIHAWTANIPAKWKPESIQEICLIAYITSKDTQHTGYQRVTYRVSVSGQKKELSRKNITEDYLKIHVIEARTGLLLEGFIIKESWSGMKSELKRFAQGEVSRCKLALQVRNNPEVTYDPQSESFKRFFLNLKDSDLEFLDITDEKLLIDIARNSSDPCAREMAVQNVFLSNPKILREIANSETNKNIREAISKRPKNGDKVFGNFALNHPQPSIRFTAAKKIENRNVLEEVAKNAKDLNVAFYLAQKLSNQELAQTIYFKIGNAPFKDFIQLRAIENITDQKLLIQIIKKPLSHWRIRKSVVKKLEDQKLLSEIAINDKNENVRKEALGKLKKNSPKLLKLSIKIYEIVLV